QTNCMETIITLAIRLSNLAGGVVESAELLKRAQAVTFNWLTILHSEIQIATDADVSRRCSRYAIWSALLCKKTFEVYADEDKLLELSTLHVFIGCSILLKDNLVGNPGALPIMLKNAVLRDLKMVH